MYRAKRLLKETPLSMQEIAVHVGRATSTALSRVFSGWEGVTPGAWRNQATNSSPPAGARAADSMWLTGLLGRCEIAARWASEDRHHPRARSTAAVRQVRSGPARSLRVGSVCSAGVDEGTPGAAGAGSGGHPR